MWLTMSFDKITTKAQTGGPDIKTDLIATVHTPVDKLQLGSEGIDEGVVGKTNPLPVAGNTAADGTGSKESMLTVGGRSQVDVISNNN